jgi:PTS system nitrogen regulatory IIA component
MKIAEFLHPDAIIASLGSRDAPGVLGELCTPLAAGARVEQRALLDTLLEREKLGSTGIGEGVAIPHGKLPGLSGLTASFGRSTSGIDFKAIDGKPTHLFLALFAPDNSAGAHLKALARISRVFKNPGFRESILRAPDARTIYQLIADEDGKY